VELPDHLHAIHGGAVRRAVAVAGSRAQLVWRAPSQRALTLAVAAAALCAIAFADVTEDYLTNDPLARWDVELARRLAGLRTAPVTDVLRVVTDVGSPAGALAVATVASVLLYRRRRLAAALFLPVVLGGAELLNLVLKLSFHRPRPEVAFVHLDTYSFPSGHAMISTAAYGALAFLGWGMLGTRRARVALVVAVALLVALECFSRLYLGVHYLSDVLAGVAGGGFWLAVSVALLVAFGDRAAARLEGSRLDRLARRVTRSV
jgi:membrane-associated phospholipid phosphatase